MASLNAIRPRHHTATEPRRSRFRRTLAEIRVVGDPREHRGEHPPSGTRRAAPAFRTGDRAGRDGKSKARTITATDARAHYRGAGAASHGTGSTSQRPPPFIDTARERMPARGTMPGRMEPPPWRPRMYSAELIRGLHEREPEVHATALRAAQVVAWTATRPVMPRDGAILEVLQRRVPDSGFQVLRTEVLVQTEFPARFTVHSVSTRPFAEQPALEQPQTSFFTIPERHRLLSPCRQRTGPSSALAPRFARSTG